MQTLYSRSVRQQDAIHTLKKCFVIKNPNLCQRVGWNFTRRAHVGVKRCNVTPALSKISPPAHLIVVTYMTEISLIVTLNNQFTSPHLSTENVINEKGIIVDSILIASV